MKILVTGAAGFIGFHLCNHLISLQFDVVGLDNLNDYYNIDLKYARLEQLGINKNSLSYGKRIESSKHENFTFIKLNIEDKELLPKLFENQKFDLVCNLAAQAGVRYSLDNPFLYIDSNIIGFLNILECCRWNNVKKILYASSSSVYGNNEKVPFSTSDNVDNPISLYAATKKSNELIAYTYSHLFDIQMIGLRFFTVYGPWGRPDMAMFLFTDAIYNNSPIKIFNDGNLYRDFTYIDDIIQGILKIINKMESLPQYKIYNIGNGSPVKLLDFIDIIEKQIGIKAKREYLSMQPGDVAKTWADTTDLKKDVGYEPKINIEVGVRNYIKWHEGYLR